MNGLGFDWHQAARASLLLVLVLLGFGILGAAAGWPNAQSGWPLAIAVAIGAALLPFAGAILDMLRDSRAKLETPWLKLDFAGAAEAATQRGEALSLPANLLRPGAAYADSGSTELEAAAERAKGDPDAVVDLADGGAWWETRLFALAASAELLGAPRRIVLLGQAGGLPGRFGGWIAPGQVVAALARQEPGYAWVMGRARAYRTALQAPAGGANPPELPDLAMYRGEQARRGEAGLVLRILLDHLRRVPPPMPGQPQPMPLEDEHRPRWVTLQAAQSLLGPWLVTEAVETTAPAKEQVLRILASSHETIAAVRGGAYAGLVDVRRVERDVLRQLAGRAR